MERATARHRRLALGTLGALSVAGFAVGAAIGGGSGSGDGTSGGSASRAGSSEPAAAATAEERHPTLAEQLTPAELAGERVVVSVDGTGLTPPLRHAVHE